MNNISYTKEYIYSPIPNSKYCWFFNISDPYKNNPDKQASRIDVNRKDKGKGTKCFPNWKIIIVLYLELKST